MKINEVTDFIGLTDSTQKEKTREDYEFRPDKLGEKVVYLEWDTYVRPRSKFFSKKLMRTLVIIGIVLGLIFAIMSEFALIIAVASLIFVSYALSMSPPEVVKYQISSYGIQCGETMYFWPQLKTFFFTSYGDMNVVAVDTTLGIPGRVFVSYEAKDKQKIKDELDKHLVFLAKEPKDFITKSYEKVISKFNFTEESQD